MNHIQLNYQLLNRQNPFGHEILASLANVPQYCLSVKQVSVAFDREKKSIYVEISIECNLANQAIATKRNSRYYDMTTILTITSDFHLVDFRRTPLVDVPHL